jgi:hypothetical protein
MRLSMVNEVFDELGWIVEGNGVDGGGING